MIYSIPSPYRFPLFQKLAASLPYELKIFFMAKGAANRRWNSNMKRYHFDYEYLRGLTFHFGKEDIYPIWVNPFVCWTINKEKPDVIIMTGWDSLTTFLVAAFCKIKKIPFVLWAGSTRNERSLRRVVSGFFVRSLVKSADAYLSYGTASKKYLIDLGANPLKIFPSYNTVDIDHIHRQSKKLKKNSEKIKRELGIKNKFLVLFVGQLIRRKGVLTLFRAVEKIKGGLDIGILWVGYGNYKKKLMHKVGSKNNVHQYFFETTTIEETVKYYSISDIFVLPSVEEVWGLVINEALAAGLPVITTEKVGASPDLIRDNVNGFVIKAGNPRILSEKIELVLKNKKLAEKLRKNTWKSIQKFNYSQNIEAFSRAILLSSNPKL